jgi:prevent-host-death family protein
MSPSACGSLPDASRRLIARQGAYDTWHAEQEEDVSKIPTLRVKASLIVETFLQYIGGTSPFDEAKMTVTTLTSREFNQDTGGAKKAAKRGPVFITDRGRPAHVLLTIEAYRRLAGGNMSLAEAMAQAGDRDFEFEPPRFDFNVEPPDLG